MANQNNALIGIETSNEMIVGNAGLALITPMLIASGLLNDILAYENSENELKRSAPQISSLDIIRTMIAVLMTGSTSFSGVGYLFPQFEFVAASLQINRIPSEPILRQRLDSIAESWVGLPNLIGAAGCRLLLNEAVTITGEEHGFVPVDMDVSIMDNSDSSKEGVGPTYHHNVLGYAPMFAYIGMETYSLGSELRPGRQHCQKGTPSFLSEMLERTRTLVGDRPVLVRMDSGNDAFDNMDHIMYRRFNGEETYFIIKHNLRKESVESYVNLAMEYSQNIQEPRPGKKVYIGSTWVAHSFTGVDGIKHDFSYRLVYEVTERTILANGQILLFPDYEVNTFWTNTDWSDEEVIASYHDHGTMEQGHAELKDELGVERLPSHRFATNEVIMALGMFSYNMLRILGQLSLEEARILFQNGSSPVISDLEDSDADIAVSPDSERTDENTSESGDSFCDNNESNGDVLPGAASGDSGNTSCPEQSASPDAVRRAKKRAQRRRWLHDEKMRAFGFAQKDFGPLPRHSVVRRRLRTVLYHVIHSAGKLSFHSDRYTLKLTSLDVWSPVIERVYRRLLTPLRNVA